MVRHSEKVMRQKMLRLDAEVAALRAERDHIRGQRDEWKGNFDAEHAAYCTASTRIEALQAENAELHREVSALKGAGVVLAGRAEKAEARVTKNLERLSLVFLERTPSDYVSVAACFEDLELAALSAGERVDDVE